MFILIYYIFSFIKCNIIIIFNGHHINYNCRRLLLYILCYYKKCVLRGRVYKFFSFEWTNNAKSANSICVISHVLTCIGTKSAAIGVWMTLSRFRISGNILKRTTDVLLYYIMVFDVHCTKTTQSRRIGDEEKNAWWSLFFCVAT